MDANLLVPARLMTPLVRVMLTIAFSFCVTLAVIAQEPCVSAKRIDVLKSQIQTPESLQPNPALRTEILEMRSALNAQNPQKSEAPKPKATPEPKMEEIAKNAPERVCAILNSEPWPGKTTVGSDGASAWIELVKNYVPVTVQLSLAPVISAGVDKGEIDKNGELASFIDRLRLRAGVAQIFGTQAVEDKNNGFLILYPLISEEKVDAWRKEYGLGPLSDYIRAMENTYRTVMVRSTVKPARVNVPDSGSSQQQAAAGLLKPDSDDKDVVKVETSLVTVDATVYGDSMPELGKNDFKVYENGQQQEVSMFNAPESPFDVVLLLDLSGSTENEVGLIKRTTKRFIEMKRDVDRLAIVTFASTQRVVSPLESDKTKLLESVRKIKDSGASNIWDSEKFAIEMLKRDSPPGRRKAIVVMTDGVDNTLFFQSGVGSETLFSDLVEEVRNSQVSIFPIYLDTEGPSRFDTRSYEIARKTLQLLATESGGNYYAARDISNLDEVYARVLHDMGRVYSLGYEPKDARRDGTWRSIKVELPGHPEIKVRARPGYYAK